MSGRPDRALLSDGRAMRRWLGRVETGRVRDALTRGPLEAVLVFRARQGGFSERGPRKREGRVRSTEWDCLIILED